LNALSGVLLELVGEEDFVEEVDGVDEPEKDDEASRLRAEDPATSAMLLDFGHSSEVLAGVIVRHRRTSRLPDLFKRKEMMRWSDWWSIVPEKCGCMIYFRENSRSPTMIDQKYPDNRVTINFTSSTYPLHIHSKPLYRAEISLISRAFHTRFIHRDSAPLTAPLAPV
jgi:hypothetical protein